uniref:Uncharacterized protein n=1 Tax=Trypanosoma congolense (strain IL3000) TaxID=1068625 RepID=G0UUX3_TRYCI|nr:hypothetical protein, unlikely [Trypanosoma congolense IL3000]
MRTYAEVARQAVMEACVSSHFFFILCPSPPPHHLILLHFHCAFFGFCVFPVLFSHFHALMDCMAERKIIWKRTKVEVRGGGEERCFQTSAMPVCVCVADWRNSCFSAWW